MPSSLPQNKMKTSEKIKRANKKVNNKYFDIIPKKEWLEEMESD